MTEKSSYEDRRIAALRRLHILDTPLEQRFERLTRLAQRFYQVETSLFSLMDEERQWFKSKQGLDVAETPREFAFCEYTLKQEKGFVVEDALTDPRICDNPLVTGEPYIRFYAGVPVREPTGFKIGTLCIIDSRPHSMGEADLETLRILASLVEDELERSFSAVATGEMFEVSQLNRSILRVQNVFLTSDNEHAAFEVLLDDLLTLTGSQIGMIGEVLYKADDSPFLKVGAITDISWSPETQALFQETQRRGMVFENMDGLLGAPVKTGQPIVSSGTMNDPRSSGFPPGHPPLNDFIGLPVHSGDRLVGLIGLANKPGGYVASLYSDLAPLLQTVGTLIERKRLYSEKRDHQKRLEDAANFDALTGLPNRRLLTELFKTELHEADLRKGSVSVCFIDLDGFKEINDEFGHSVGDQVLMSVANQLKGAVRAHDLVSRLGGDEFIAILRDVEVEAVYQRLLDAIRQPIPFKHHMFQLSGSMGITIYPEDDTDSDLLIRHADQAMYAAKEAGRNCFRVFDLEMHQSRKERVRIIEQIPMALARNEFELHYQPQINYGNGNIEGFEALIRWLLPSGELLPPLSFLPHIEHTEHDSAIGRFVLQEAIAVLTRFEQEQLPYSVSVNLSPSHFLGQDFVADLRHALATTSSELRSKLILEVLETTALDDAQIARKTIIQCKELGVQVSLDDFGTGYSSLNYFRNLPVDEIKIDKSFVMDMLHDTDDAMIVEAIISLCRSFKRRVVAEGVESPALEARLKELGCDIGQGYTYSRPVPLEEALAWARQYRGD
ncbi:EAL domain-containing protein [uncultured Marinobacter sp.]|uniref:bifunctional diguanylate cyclase/phosphodiesterase n=1 Tax=uncultured Marinobacter sp. TaxID=187379 RepID=UPI0030DC368C